MLAIRTYSRICELVQDLQPALGRELGGASPPPSETYAPPRHRGSGGFPPRRGLASNVSATNNRNFVVWLPRARMTDGLAQGKSPGWPFALEPVHAM